MKLIPTAAEAWKHAKFFKLLMLNQLAYMITSGHYRVKKV
jgi:hypothetical protein